MRTTPVIVQAADRMVTWSGVAPRRWAIAASTRPSGRLTSREYRGAPALAFCALDSARIDSAMLGRAALAGSAGVAGRAGPAGFEGFMRSPTMRG